MLSSTLIKPTQVEITSSNNPNPIVENNKASVTAVSVAWGFARAVIQSGGEYFPLKEAKLTEHLCDIGRNSLTGMNYILAKLLSWLPYSIQSGFFSKVVVPGYDQVMLLRKLMIKNKIETAIKNGVKQIVFLGGGYDIRGLMTALVHSDVTVYELDRGKTRDCKLIGLSSVYLQTDYNFSIRSSIDNRTTYINHNMFYIDCDLAENRLQDVLRQEGFDSTEATLIIAEGCTMYLDIDVNKHLLEFASSLAHPLNELLFSYYSRSQRQYSALSHAAQKRTDELYRFCTTKQEAFDFVQEQGYVPVEQFVPSTFLSGIGMHDAAKYYATHPDHPIEFYFMLKSAGETLKHYVSVEDVPVMSLDAPTDEQRVAEAAAPPRP